jgi:hypothetical protein
MADDVVEDTREDTREESSRDRRMDKELLALQRLYRIFDDLDDRERVRCLFMLVHRFGRGRIRVDASRLDQPDDNDQDPF